MQTFIVLDTETTNSIEEPLMYDIGWAVIDEDGNLIKTRSYVVEDVFMNLELMSSAYYAEKRSLYWDGIEDGSRILASLSSISWQLRKDCRDYEVQFICAHNARFDARSTRLTQRYITKSAYRYFLPYGIEIWDSLKMARLAFGKDDGYTKFCKEHNYFTTKGQKRFTAEILYRYLTNNPEFEESHTGLEDVLIEKDIVLACIERGVVNGKLYA